jgi:hypothetical protein
VVYAPIVDSLHLPVAPLAGIVKWSIPAAGGERISDSRRIARFFRCGRLHPSRQRSLTMLQHRTWVLARFADVGG